MFKMNWSPQQVQALDSVGQWLRERSKPFYRLFGYAGTGKTTLAKHLAEGAGRVLFGAFTGKASSVMRSKGCSDATTIHKLIYKPNPKSETRAKELVQKRLDFITTLMTQGKNAEEAAADPEVKKIEAEIKAEEENHKKPNWILNLESPVASADLVVIDEVSMVDGPIANDLLSFKVPILVLGDPAQLPPVFGTGFFMQGKPEMLLTEIHRQDADNPILQLASMVRAGQRPTPGRYGDSEVIEREDLSRCKEAVVNADQLLVGANATRHAYNKRLRELKGLVGELPVKGDKIICTRNDRDRCLFNGEIWRVEECVDTETSTVDLVLTSEDGQGQNATSAHKALFLNEPMRPWDLKNHGCFEYGQAITVHKSQGSQWDNVFILDESRKFRQDQYKHLYTALTRAAKQVTLVL